MEGTKAFRESLEPDARKRLSAVLKMADDLRRRGLADVESREGKSSWSLAMRLPGEKGGLARIGANGAIVLTESVFEKNAALMMAVIEEIVKPKSFRQEQEPTPGLVAAVTVAYELAALKRAEG